MPSKLNYKSMDQLSSDRSSNLPMPDPALMDLLEQPKEKGITSWFRWSSKRERKERVSLRVKTVGYQVRFRGGVHGENPFSDPCCAFRGFSLYQRQY